MGRPVAVLGPVGREHVAHLEGAHVRHLAVGVEPHDLQEPREQRRPQDRALHRQRVLQGEQALAIAPAHPLEAVRVEEHPGHALGEPGRVQHPAHRARQAQAGRLGHGLDLAATGQGERDLIVAPDADDLLDQVVLLVDVAPEARHHHLQVVTRAVDCEAQRLQDAHRLLAGRARPDHPLDAGHPQRHAPVRPRLRVDVDHPPRDRAAAQLGHQLRRAPEHVGGRLDVAAALEPIRRVGREAERPRGPADGAGIPVGRLQQHPRGGARHLAVRAAHHPADADRALGVAHQRHVGVERPLLTVQGLGALARPRAPHHHRVLGQRVQIEGVQRLAQLPHDVVRHVDQVVDRAQAHRAEPLGEPGRRRLHGESGDHAGAEARAEVGRLHPHRGEAGRLHVGLGRDHAGEAEGCAGEGRDLARHAHHRQGIGAIGRDLDVEDPVVEPEVGGEVGAERRLGGQQEDAAVVVAQPQLLLRAEDAFGDHAADLGRLHRPQAGQPRAGRGEGSAEAGRDVGGAADHPELLAGHRHADESVHVAGRARAELALHRFDLAHHDARQSLDHRGDRLHPDAGVGEPVGHRARLEVRVDELLQPAIGDLHRPGRPANCCRKRRSLSKKSRMSSISYLSRAIRSMPMPKAQPVTSSGS